MATSFSAFVEKRLKIERLYNVNETKGSGVLRGQCICHLKKKEAAVLVLEQALRVPITVTPRALTADLRRKSLLDTFGTLVLLSWVRISLSLAQF